MALGLPLAQTGPSVFRTSTCWRMDENIESGHRAAHDTEVAAQTASVVKELTLWCLSQRLANSPQSEVFFFFFFNTTPKCP